MSRAYSKCMVCICTSTEMLNLLHLDKNIVWSMIYIYHITGFGREAGDVRSRRVFKHDLTGKLYGTGQNRSFKWGLRLSRVFVGRGSTVHVYYIHINDTLDQMVPQKLFTKDSYATTVPIFYCIESHVRGRNTLLFLTQKIPDP